MFATDIPFLILNYRKTFFVYDKERKPKNINSSADTSVRLIIYVFGISVFVCSAFCFFLPFLVIFKSMLLPFMALIIFYNKNNKLSIKY